MAPVPSRRSLDRQRAQRVDDAGLDDDAPRPRARAEGIVNAVVPQNDVEGYAREITRLWAEARDKFMAIGEYLAQAKRTLRHGDYELMIRTRLPFNTRVAHKMRTVAEAVRDGRLPRERLPNSYATAYELTLLSEAEFQEAESRGLVRPDVYLREVQALRAELRTAVSMQRMVALARERERLAAAMERTRARIAEIDRLLRGGDEAGRSVSEEGELSP